MRKIVRINYFFLILFSLIIVNSVKAQLSVHAGADQTMCPGIAVNLGGTPSATGGLAPYTYSWAPTTGLNLSNGPNPTAAPSATTSYTLTVTDDTGAVSSDVVIVTMSSIYYVTAGRDTSICVAASAGIGGPNNVTWAGINYSWSPGAELNDSTLNNPVASPANTTTYTLTATIPGCPAKTDFVTVTIIPTPQINAGNDTTINEGETAILHGSGGFNYVWNPQNTLTYFYTANPDAEPIVTTTYYLYGTDESNKCPAYDDVTVFIIPDNDVVFYNTFTPNGDGNNDTWYIGNIYKYPDNKLEVYNRYGKLVFKANGYLNSWEGKAFGEELPSATYFYIMDLGDGSKKYHGTVTIVR